MSPARSMARTPAPTRTAGTILRLLAALLALGLLASACGSRAPAEDPAPPREAAPQPPAPEPEPQPAPEPEPEPEPQPEPEPEPEPEPDPYEATVRGAWVHLFDDALKTRAGIAEVVEELAAADANAIIAQVARRHDAYYRSEVLPRTADPKLESDLDVLEELIRVAGPHDIDVHAWITVAPTWHPVYEDLPAPGGWLPPARGLAAPEGQRWVTRTVDGEWSDYLDPGLPQVRDHVAAMVGELAARDGVAGVHLDYVRYASERHGYHPVALERYRQETGASGTPAPDDPAWSEWRRRRTTEIVAHARAAVDAAGRDVVLSAAVIAWGEGPGGPATARFADSRAYTEALQDWPRWARHGLVDALMPMVYFRADDVDQARWFDEWTAFQERLARRTGTPVVPGVGGWLNRPEATLAQTVASMGVGHGAMVYSYQQPTADESRQVWGQLAERRWGFEDPA
jgi:uncharacterized lipoprotein YddW (UPF0748 family)